MAVMLPKERWTDDRLDGLDKKVAEGFAEMRGRFDRVEAQVETRFEAVETRFASIEARLKSIETRFEVMNDHFHALNRTLLGGGVVILAAMIGTSAF